MFSIIPAQYYQAIYLILITIITILYNNSNAFSLQPDGRYACRQNVSSRAAAILTLFMVVFIGFRPINGHAFVDMGNYAQFWTIFADPNYQFTWDTDNILFDNIQGYMSGAGIDVRVFFVTIATIYFGCMFWACRLLFPKNVMLSLLVCLAAFSTFSYGTNGIKAGAAASLFLVALGMFANDKPIGTIIFLLLSLGFHHSMQLPIIGFIICLFFKKPSYYRLFWVFSFVMALLRIKYFQFLFGGLTDEQGAGYLLGDGITSANHILGGFRIDFILYGFIPILIGWVETKRNNNLPKEYLFLLNLYTFINSIWLLCMYAEFTNRIAYLSWLMYPVVLIYPLMYDLWKSKISPRTIIFCHLFFSLFMVFIYYR